METPKRSQALTRALAWLAALGPVLTRGCGDPPDPLGAGETSRSCFESVADLAAVIPGCPDPLELEGRWPTAVGARGPHPEDVDYVQAERGRCQPVEAAEFNMYVADRSAVDQIAKREERLACSLESGEGLIAGLEPATLVRGENWLATSGEDFSWEAIEQITEGTQGRVVVMCQLGPKGIPADVRRRN